MGAPGCRKGATDGNHHTEVCRYQIGADSGSRYVDGRVRETRVDKSHPRDDKRNDPRGTVVRETVALNDCLHDDQMA